MAIWLNFTTLLFVYFYTPTKGGKKTQRGQKETNLKMVNHVLRVNDTISEDNNL